MRSEIRIFSAKDAEDTTIPGANDFTSEYVQMIISQWVEKVVEKSSEKSDTM